MFRAIQSAIDHTLLNPTAQWPEIKRLCDEGIRHQVASVCIPPSYVQQAKQYVDNKIKICTVVGFPNGYQSTAVKVFETKDAIGNGADEIDMVINLGWVKDGYYDRVVNEIHLIKEDSQDKCLKVIIETCYLNEEEKIQLCQIISQTGADYIKTSTGFGSGGASIADIHLFKQYLSPVVKIKAAGGIKDLTMAQQYLDAGVSRLGSSSLLKIIDGLNHH